MKRWLLTEILICSVALAGGMTASAEDITWEYSEENLEKTYQGRWAESSAGFQFYLPTEGWDEYDPQSELTEETETEYPEAAGAETEAETASGEGAQADTESQAGTEAETEAETDVPETDFAEEGISEYCLEQPGDGIILNLYHLESEDGAYPDMEDVYEMFSSDAGTSNVYYAVCNGIIAVHFDAGATENLAFPEITGDRETGFTGSVAVLSIRCDDREERELFADEVFSSVRLNVDNPLVYLNDGRIWTEEYDYWVIQDASDKYVRMLSHKKFVSNEEEDEPGAATGFALMDLDEDGLMELLVRYIGYSPSYDDPVTDYALYTYSEGEEKLLLTMEGQGPDDVLFYFPGMRMLEYDTYTSDEYHYDCYEYDGSEILHSDYYDYDWDLYEDEESLQGDQFLRLNTEEERDKITDWMMESMEEALDYMGGF